MKNRGKDIGKNSHLQQIKTITPDSLIIFYKLL